MNDSITKSIVLFNNVYADIEEIVEAKYPLIVH